MTAAAGRPARCQLSRTPRRTGLGTCCDGAAAVCTGHGAAVKRWLPWFDAIRTRSARARGGTQRCAVTSRVAVSAFCKAPVHVRVCRPAFHPRLWPRLEPMPPAGAHRDRLTGLASTRIQYRRCPSPLAPLVWLTVVWCRWPTPRQGVCIFG